MSKLIILDPGHGRETPGKQSPVWEDGSQLFEWEFNRDIVKRIELQLLKLNIPCVITVETDEDVSLADRCAFANKFDKDSIFLSIHANAGGGTGYECYTSIGETKADPLATILCDKMREAFPNEKIREDFADGDSDKEVNFYVLKYTNCPAVLSENFFMDTESDCRLLLSSKERERIALAHVEAIKEWIKV